MYQTITVKYIGWTNTKPARYKATCNAKSITWSLSKFPATMHKNSDCAILIAKELAKQMKWEGKWHGGVDNKGQYQFVVECPSYVTGSFVVTYVDCD